MNMFNVFIFCFLVVFLEVSNSTPDHDTCAPGEFHCGDGICLLAEVRCNNIADCEDLSDELDCIHNASDCPSNKWKTYNSSYCFLRVDSPMEWSVAKDYCRQFDAYLLSLTGVSYDSSTFHILSKHLDIEVGDWIGLRFSNGRGWWESDRFIYFDEESLARWEELEPDLTKGSCAQISFVRKNPENGLFLNMKINSCYQPNKFVCFKHQRIILLVKGHISCNETWDLDRNSNSCLKTFRRKKNYTQASEDCKLHKSHLAVPITEFEKKTIISHFLGLTTNNSSRLEYRSKRMVNESRKSATYRPTTSTKIATDPATTSKVIKDPKIFTDEFYVGIERRNGSYVDSDGKKLNLSHAILEPASRPNASSVYLNCVKGDKTTKNLYASDCFSEANYVCQKPVKKLKNLKLSIIVEDIGRVIQPENFFDSGSPVYSIPPRAYSRIKLKCNVSSEGPSIHADEPVVWKKDDIYMDRTTEATLHLGSGSNLLNGGSYIYNSQGRYSCASWLSNHTLLYSRPIVVVSSDVMTFKLYVTIRRNRFSRSVLVDEDCSDNEESFCVSFDTATNIQLDENNPEIKLVTEKYNVYSNTSFEKREFIIKYEWNPYEYEREWQLHLLREGFRKAESFVNTFLRYQLRRTDLSKRKKREAYWEDIEDLVGHNNSLGVEKGNGEEIPEFVLKSSRGCSVTNFNIDGIKLSFGVFLGEGHANSTSSCLIPGIPSMALGFCSGNWTNGYSWEFKLFYDCIYIRDTIGGNDLLINDVKAVIEEMNNDPRAAADILFNFTSSRAGELTPEIVSLLNDAASQAVKKQRRIEAKFGEKTASAINNLFSIPVSKLESTSGISDQSFKLAETLEQMLLKVELGQSELTWPEDNFVIHMVKPDGKGVYFGQLSADKDGDTAQKKGGTKYISGSEPQIRNDVTADVFLPQEVMQAAKKQGVPDFLLKANIVIYKRDVFLGHDSKEDVVNKLNSHVIMGSLDGAMVTNLKEKIRLRFQLIEKSQHPPVCVYADQRHDEAGRKSSKWIWSKQGMSEAVFVNEEQTVVECFSSHLTNFAVLAGFDMKASTTVARVLTVISIIGAVLSIVCLLLVILCQILFKKFRKGQFQSALLNLSVALILVNLLLLLGLDKTGTRWLCMTVAALLHYFLLVSFSWMLIEAILQYLKFVKVFNTHVSRFVLKACLPAWGIPALIVGTIAIIDYKQFNGAEHYCWLDKNAFYYAFLLPLGLIVCSNVVIFIIIVKSITCDRPKGMQTNQTRGKLVWLQVQAGMCCFVIMGLTWSFALFAFGGAALTMQFLFAIFNSLQGFFIFILFNLREDPVRKAWSDLFKKKSFRRTKAGKKKNLVSGETYTFTSKGNSSESGTKQETSGTKETKFSTNTISD